MKTRVVASVVGLGVLSATAILNLGIFAPETVEYTFQSYDGRGTLTYRCAIFETTEESKQNARAAHAMFEPVLVKSARQQAKAMAASMSPDSSSSDVVKELKVKNAEADASRREAHRAMQRRFGCSYTGSS